MIQWLRLSTNEYRSLSPPPQLLQAAKKIAAAESSLRQANQRFKTTKTEVGFLRSELETARVRERKAVEAAEAEKRRAEESVAKLEGALDRADREHVLFREQTEGVLEQLRLAVQVEQENASQVCVTIVEKQHNVPQLFVLAFLVSHDGLCRR